MLDFIELSEYPGYFIAHSPPRLKRIVGGSIFECTQTPNSSKDSYWSVTVKTKEGKFVKRNMHRLLMQTFVPNLDNKAHVNHIDGNKANNELSNLEWATPKENAHHAISTGLTDAYRNIKTVYQYLLNGEFVTEFSSDTVAENLTGIPRQNISKATLGLRPHAGYFQWKREKFEKVSPVIHNYIKGYRYGNVFYPTVADLAKSLGYVEHLNKLTLKRLTKPIRENTVVVFYD